MAASAVPLVRCTRALIATSAGFRSRSRGGIVIGDAIDMSSPVTRGELREELAQLEIRLEAKLESKLDQKLESKLDQKLEMWGGALLARIADSERRLLAELARHCNSIQESLSKQLSVIDEKYADLPARVTRLEAKAFARRRR
jgi:hypothetical protein